MGEEQNHQIANAYASEALALAAFQLIDHWGNRHTPRPTPRADVLAAALLSGFGRLASQTATAEVLDALAARVRQATAAGRYVGVLVSELAGQFARGIESLDTWCHGQRQWRTQLLAELYRETRFRHIVDRGHEINLAVLGLAHTIAARLAAGDPDAIELPGLPQRDGLVDLLVMPVAPGIWRMSPWPLAGRRLTIVTEGHGDETNGAPRPMALASRWTLLAAGAPAD